MKSSNVSKGKKLSLSADADSRRVYSTTSKIVNGIVQGNAVATLRPSQFVGLIYDVLDTQRGNFVTIQTRGFGNVNIFVSAEICQVRF